MPTPPKKPSQTETPPAPSTDPTDPNFKIDVRASIQSLHSVLNKIVNPDYGLTPGQLVDAADMYRTYMHLLKVTPEFWFNHIDAPSELAELATNVDATYALMQVEGLHEKALEIIKSSMELSLKEISAARKVMLAGLAELSKVPLPGTTIH